MIENKATVTVRTHFFLRGLFDVWNIKNEMYIVTLV
jgi:hypothetical protein